MSKEILFSEIARSRILKGVNTLAQDTPTSVTEAYAIIDECHQRWQKLKSHEVVGGDDFFLGY